MPGRQCTLLISRPQFLIVTPLCFPFHKSWSTHPLVWSNVQYRNSWQSSCAKENRCLFWCWVGWARHFSALHLAYRDLHTCSIQWSMLLSISCSTSYPIQIDNLNLEALVLDIWWFTQYRSPTSQYPLTPILQHVYGNRCIPEAHTSHVNGHQCLWTRS